MHQQPTLGLWNLTVWKQLTKDSALQQLTWNIGLKDWGKSLQLKGSSPYLVKLGAESQYRYINKPLAASIIKAGI